MEHGNDTSYKLETFFEIAVSYNERVQQTNDIQWIIIFDETRKKEVLGISKAGKWVFKDEERFFVLKDKKNFLCCVKLLEIPYIEIKANVEERFTEIMNKEGVCLSTIFPFFQIVEFVFCNLFDDYWFDLAWLWYEKLHMSERYKLASQLEKISKTKKISQRNRQKANREAKNLVTGFNESLMD